MEQIPSVALGPDDDAERREWQQALARVIERNAYCLGPEVAAFEKQVAEALGVRHAIGLANGTDALRLGLAALRVGPGDEVVVPAFSFFASASAVAHLGARPRFVDLDAGTLTLDPAALASAIGPKTRAVLPVHLYGQTAAMDAIAEACSARGIPILEDAAQSFGVRYCGRQAGTIGRAGIFSFYPTKNLGAPGDAGMLVTGDDDVGASVRSLRAHGDLGGYRHQTLGWNARMDGFQAAILSIRLRRLPEIQRRRAENAAAYERAIAAHRFGERVRTLDRTPGSEHCWHQFIVRVPDRDRVRAFLGERGIQTAVHYPSTIPAQPAFAFLGHRSGEFPVAERAAREVLALPVHHRLRPGDPERVVDALAAFFEHS